jgi:hypothetical protein
MTTTDATSERAPALTKELNDLLVRMERWTWHRYSTDYGLRRVDLPITTVTRGASAASYIVPGAAFSCI